MQLTATIIFIGALIGFILWIVKTVGFLLSPKTQFALRMGGEISLGIVTPVILFLVMAVSAGVAWG